MSILKVAGRMQTDIKQFIENSASGNSMKYSAVPNARHFIYIPTKKQLVTRTDGSQEEVEGIIAYSVDIHELNMPGDKYKAVPCIENVVVNAEDGTIINDGICPFCDRVNDAWDIVNYRMGIEEANCQLVGEDRDKHLKEVKKGILSTIKCNTKTPILYMLVFVYNTDSKGEPIISDATGLPEYTPKIWKLRPSRIEKMQEQVTNAGGVFGGSEIAIKYPDNQDPRLLVTGSTTAPLFESKQFIMRYPGLKEQLQSDAEKFNWDGVEKAFPELTDLSSNAANKMASELFKDWDAYQKRLAVDPNAQYLEYRRHTQPVPVSTNTQQSTVGQIAQQPQVQQGIQMPMASMDANALFSGANNSINI